PQENPGPRVVGEAGEAAIGDPRPFPGPVERGLVLAGTASGRRPFPKRAGDDRGHGRSELLSDGCRIETAFLQTKRTSQSADTRAQHDNSCIWMFRSHV